MCGIAGIIYKNSLADPLDAINGMLKQMLHRGQDDWGIMLIDNRNSNIDHNKISHLHSDKINCVLGHRRLSILDLSENGRQPMMSHDGRFTIIFNGEIYNYIELRNELKGTYPFKTNSDTEVILAAYAHWGISMLNRLNGMFAIAIWDNEKNKLICARDPIGIKPFYYSTHNGDFVFASEPRPVLTYHKTKGKIDKETLSDFLILGVTDHSEHTFYKEVKQLPGGHWMEVNANGKIGSINTFWDPEHVTPISKDADVMGIMKDALEQSVKLHLRSDVPVGSALSGGIDSGTIVYYVGQLMGTNSHQYKCLTLSSPGFEHDESELAKLVCEKTGTTWLPVETELGNIESEFPDFIRAIGEPFSNMTMFAQFQVMKFARQKGLKVMIDGQGGDELFIGYDRVAPRIMIDYLKGFKLNKFFREWIGLKYHANLGLMQTVLSNVYFNNASIAIQRRSGRVEKYLNHDLLTSYRKDVADEVFSFNGIKKTQALELKKYVLPRLLKYEDRNSMIFGIESRVPLISKDLLEVGLSLPVEWLVHNGWTKYCMRKAMDKKLPDQIVWNKLKIGFDIPEHKWIEYLRSSFVNWVNELPENNVIDKVKLASDLRKVNTINDIRIIWPVLSTALWMHFEEVSV